MIDAGVRRQGRLLPGLRSLLVTLWAGSVWTVGYLAAPTLFATLADRTLAGTIAGSLFRVEAWLSLACGVLLLGVLTVDRGFVNRRSCRWLVVAMLTCVAVGYFGLQPFMAELKASAALHGGVMDEAARARFGILHGVASVIYLLQSIAALVLVLRQR